MSSGDAAYGLRGDFLFGAEPVFEIVAVFPAARLVEFIRALPDLIFKFLGFAQHCRGRFLCGIFFGRGALLFAVTVAVCLAAAKSSGYKTVTLAC